LLTPWFSYHLIVAARSVHRARVDSEDGGIALLEGQDHGAGLHPGALLSHHELTALKVLAGLIQQDRYLHREDVLPVKVAMKTVIVLRGVLEEQRRRTDLTSLMAAIEERGVVTREAHLLSHAFLPLVGNRREVRIGGRP
jgi:hypothetical protein